MHCNICNNEVYTGNHIRRDEQTNKLYWTAKRRPWIAAVPSRMWPSGLVGQEIAILPVVCSLRCLNELRAKRTLVDPASEPVNLTLGEDSLYVYGQATEPPEEPSDVWIDLEEREVSFGEWTTKPAAEPSELEAADNRQMGDQHSAQHKIDIAVKRQAIEQIIDLPLIELLRIVINQSTQWQPETLQAAQAALSLRLPPQRKLTVEEIEIEMRKISADMLQAYLY